MPVFGSNCDKHPPSARSNALASTTAGRSGSNWARKPAAKKACFNAMKDSSAAFIHSNLMSFLSKAVSPNELLPTIHMELLWSVARTDRLTQKGHQIRVDEGGRGILHGIEASFFSGRLSSPI